MAISFWQLLALRMKSGRRLCIGLDPDVEKIPPGVSVVDFLSGVVDATHDLAAVFKPNIAFFEDRGSQGIEEYEELVRRIRRANPFVPIIGDWKRADIGNTNRGYARAAFDLNGLDALTVNPYFGKKALGPFLERTDKGIVVLCRTSNDGADELQNLICDVSGDPILGMDKAPLYQVVARNVSEKWNENGNCALVVGATAAEELLQVCRIAPNIFKLIPGVGAQGGDLVAAVRAARNPRVDVDFVINVSSSILYAFKEERYRDLSFAQASRKAALDFDFQIRVASVEVLLTEIGAIVYDEHVVYTSGKHGRAYVNWVTALEDPMVSWEVANAFAVALLDEEFDVLVGPTHTGDKLARDVATALYLLGRPVPVVYAQETEDPGRRVFPRGQDKRVKDKDSVVIDDVLTTGGTFDEVFAAIHVVSGRVVKIAAAANRSSNVGGFKETPLLELLHFDMEQWDETQCQLCREHKPITISVGHGEKFLTEHGEDTAMWPANRTN